MESTENMPVVPQQPEEQIPSQQPEGEAVPSQQQEGEVVPVESTEEEVPSEPAL